MILGIVMALLVVGWTAAVFTVAQFCALQDREDLNRDRRR
jgi:hypothetical protein